jgi:hypothetical protein
MKFLLEVKFPYSYLDFERPPFPNRLSYNAEILRQNGMHTAGRTQTAGRTAAPAGYLYFSNWRPPMIGPIDFLKIHSLKRAQMAEEWRKYFLYFFCHSYCK